MKKSNSNPMLYRRCGKSGLLLPAISFGLWHNFGKEQTQKKANKLIFTAIDAGITHFDLANNYGPPPGQAEMRFGKIVKKHLKAYRDQLIISSKAGYLMWDGPYGEWGSKKHLIASLDQSLIRLKLDYLDIFYSHRPDPNTPFEETAEALTQIIKSGKALYVGISNYNHEQTGQMAKLLKKQNVPLLIHQYAYSMLQSAPENKLFPTLKELGVGGIAFCPLAQGRLTDKYLKGIPKNSRATKNHFLKTADITKSLLTLTSKLSDLAKKREQSLAQMSIAWVLRNPTTTSALIGASSPKQIIENCQALKQLDFSEKQTSTIKKLLDDYNHKSNSKS